MYNNTSLHTDINYLFGIDMPHRYSITVPECNCTRNNFYTTQSQNLDIYVYGFFVIYIMKIIVDYMAPVNEIVNPNNNFQENVEDDNAGGSKSYHSKSSDDHTSEISKTTIDKQTLNEWSNCKVDKNSSNALSDCHTDKLSVTEMQEKYSIDETFSEVFYEDIQSQTKINETSNGDKVVIIPPQDPDYIYDLGIALRNYLDKVNRRGIIDRGLYHPTSARTYVDSNCYPESSRERNFGIDMAFNEYQLPKDDYEAWEYLVSFPYLIPYIIKKKESDAYFFSIETLETM